MLSLFKLRGEEKGQKRARELSLPAPDPCRSAGVQRRGHPPDPAAAAQHGPHGSLPLGWDTARKKGWGISLLPAFLLGGRHRTAQPKPQPPRGSASRERPSRGGKARRRTVFSHGFFEAGHPVQERPPVQFTHCHGFGGVGSVGSGTASTGAGHIVQGKRYRS